LRPRSALVVVASFAALLFAAQARSAVILSELCDPQNNYTTDRFLEIYNGGATAVDLTGWSIVAVANNADVCTWSLSGTIAAGQAKVAGGTNPTVATFTIDFASSVWSTTAGYMNWNGKVGDGAKLKDNTGTVIDLVVVTGAANSTFENRDYVRNSNITNPNPVYNLNEWTATPVLLATDGSPGSHNGSAPPPAGPVISDIVTDPTTPVAGVGTDVHASVVDTTSHTITAVALLWGTTVNSLPNSIPMSNVADSTYRTDSPIPAQLAGATIYYRVQADDAVSSSQSSTQSYSIPGSAGPPTVLAVGEMSDSTLLVFFSEDVQQASAETPAYYTVDATTAVAATQDPGHLSQVLVTMRNLVAGTRTLTANGVLDLDGNPAANAARTFNYVDVSVPADYYNGTAGLEGSALRVALHNIIKGHTSVSYSGALTAFQTTDVRPDGKVWDPYSDIPGGTPPYEYTFAQTSSGGPEGSGYNREHSFPQSWFNGNSPMYSDLWILYPTDAHVNNTRANYPYGQVGSASVTSLNGSKLGTSTTAGYGGTVFEPIDPFKGDLARSAFYVATRYFNEDAGWTGSPSTSGANLLPWAADQYLLWSVNDPPSWKERMRNGAIYVIQHNRNPFVDHPEFVSLIYDSSNVVVGVGNASGPSIALRQNSPNPFTARTMIGFELPQRERVNLRVYDVSGRLVRTLESEAMLEAGVHSLEWNGRDDSGAPVEAGLYFYAMRAGSASVTRRMVLVR
jgi:endonuclease I